MGRFVSVCWAGKICPQVFHRRANALSELKVWGRPFGGRTKRTPNRKTVEKRLAEEQARKISSDLEPLEYMLEVMRDPTADQTRRDMMAKAAAPYRHPQLQEAANDLLRKYKRRPVAQTAR